MYNVAVCDDEETLCSQFERTLESYIFDKKITLDVFYSGEELIKYLSEEQHFDLIFLDIELRLMDGIEVGRTIRDKLGDENVQIVYISAKQQYAMELFETRPMNFLVKPILNGDIINMLEKAMKLDGICKTCFELKKGKEIIRIPCGEIQYFESDNRKINVYTEQGKYEMYGKLNAIEITLPAFFIRIHQSYIVNSMKIIRWKASEVYVTDLKSLPISRNYRKKICSFLLKEEK